MVAHKDPYLGPGLKLVESLDLFGFVHVVNGASERQNFVWELPLAMTFVPWTVTVDDFRVMGKAPIPDGKRPVTRR